MVILVFMHAVFGALSQNPFYVLAGIFGLIDESKQGDQPAENKEE